MTHKSLFHRFLDLLGRHLSALVISNGGDILVRLNMLLQKYHRRHRKQLVNE